MNRIFCQRRLFCVKVHYPLLKRKINKQQIQHNLERENFFLISFFFIFYIFIFYFLYFYFLPSGSLFHSVSPFSHTQANTNIWTHTQKERKKKISHLALRVNEVYVFFFFFPSLFLCPFFHKLKHLIISLQTFC